MMRLVQLPVSPPGGPGPWSVSGDYYHYEGWHQTQSHPLPCIQVLPSSYYLVCGPDTFRGGQPLSSPCKLLQKSDRKCFSTAWASMLEKKKIKYRNSGANLRSLPFRQREKKEHNNNNEVLFSFVNCHSRSRRLCDAALVTWQDVTRVARDNSELVTNSWQVYLSGNKNEWDTRPFRWPFKEILHQKYPR